MEHNHVLLFCQRIKIPNPEIDSIMSNVTYQMEEIGRKIKTIHLRRRNASRINFDEIEPNISGPEGG